MFHVARDEAQDVDLLRGAGVRMTVATHIPREHRHWIRRCVRSVERSRSYIVSEMEAERQIPAPEGETFGVVSVLVVDWI